MIQVAQVVIETCAKPGTRTGSRTGAKIERVLTPLKTVVTLVAGDGPTVALVTSSMPVIGIDVSWLLRTTAADALGISTERVLLLSSHNHCSPSLQLEANSAWSPAPSKPTADNVTPLGKSLASQLGRACRGLAQRMQPVTVAWAVGHERRITYNRKGRRADGSTYFMREEDRMLVAGDYTGDIDDDAIVIAFLGAGGEPVGFLTSFTGHPVTAYHPERMIAFGEWPQLACDELGRAFGDAPAAFLQGCAGDTNSKRMLCGDVELSRKFGRYLGKTFVRAVRSLTPSTRSDHELRTDTARVPCAALPTIRALERELAEIDDFISRADAGDEETRHCVGLNFPRALSPAYRARLVEMMRPWSQWALRTRRRGQDTPSHVEMPTAALRLGDVGIVGMPCEPFLGIGRQIKAGSPLPVAVPCGYLNANYGYVPDGPNCRDAEYMSSSHRYTRFRPPFRKPAGDALAKCGLRMVRSMATRPGKR